MYNIGINELDSSAAKKMPKYLSGLATPSGHLQQLNIPHTMVPALQKSMSPLALCHILRSHLHGSGVLQHLKWPLASACLGKRQILK